MMDYLLFQDFNWKKCPKTYSGSLVYVQSDIVQKNDEKPISVGGGNGFSSLSNKLQMTLKTCTILSH
ncbi:hypothetical protein TTHERM_000628669 (macronuclear) [Tetrahymena thermophila SB210]|uniref:Uncharacterized protein n=1 Tax=Tetrahymena thermophila (strain SB210) TaxID=312017 RepID=W7X854_TETTS|nr:hypothetical protein TTHERM_000628669 [Tetrahymena thermophila SB210]EWS73527.1 hypothetical protein TTHERM_000628669 [Tetrahymena thermophila SB210]|eukprot:XP_012653917.1 hypothetical protein TTHERM_000628669 [Tetrahymena thermophila SB210]